MSRKATETVAEYLIRNDWEQTNNNKWLFLGDEDSFKPVDEHAAYMLQQLDDLSKIDPAVNSILSVLGDH